MARRIASSALGGFPPVARVDEPGLRGRRDAGRRNRYGRSVESGVRRDGALQGDVSDGDDAVDESVSGHLQDPRGMAFEERARRGSLPADEALDGIADAADAGAATDWLRSRVRHRQALRRQRPEIEEAIPRARNRGRADRFPGSPEPADSGPHAAREPRE